MHTVVLRFCMAGLLQCGMSGSMAADIQWTPELTMELPTQLWPEAKPNESGYQARLEALWLRKHPDLPRSGRSLAKRCNRLLRKWSITTQQPTPTEEKLTRLATACKQLRREVAWLMAEVESAGQIARTKRQKTRKKRVAKICRK